MGAELAVLIIAYGANLFEDAGGYPDLQHLSAELKRHGLFVKNYSRLWRSSAWPDPNDPPFYNAALQCITNLKPVETLEALHAIEAAAGRRRDGPRNAPRSLDLDLISWDDQILDLSGLIIPHPRAHERRFVMGPIRDIDPGWRHPLLGRTAADLFETAPVGRDAYPLEDDPRWSIKV
ncbi:MAG: 2-amino-4-hydroxy-6-hydroxymethyldihydropteridine diphosphokinase [Asticcacaulis sp.]